MIGIAPRALVRKARAALAALERSILNGANRALENVAAAAEKAARATTAFNDGPRDGRHSNLRDSIEHTLLPDYRARLRAMAPHAIFIEAGTRPHVIKARRGPLLHFKIGGRWISTRQVNHPGTKARWFMRDAGEAVRPVFRRNLEAITNTAIGRYRRAR